MYESPIDLTFLDPIIQERRDKLDAYVFECVQKVGCNVNKEELVKALQYDRDQFDKGYHEGYAKGWENAMATSKWIPIELLEPEDGDHVLIYYEENGTVNEAVYCDGKNHWYEPIEEYWSYSNDRVHYWQPMPEPPKEDDDDG